MTPRAESCKYSVVVPVFKNESTIAALLLRADAIAAHFDSNVEFIFVVDGSPDGSASLLVAGLANRSLASSVIELSKNFGAFSAIKEGLSKAKGEFVGVMAADLQEPVTLLIEFFETLNEGKSDVCVGVRDQRGDPWTSRVTAGLFWWSFRKFVMGEIPVGGVDVFACSAKVAALLASARESHSSLIGYLYWLGFDVIEVSYSREARVNGKSAWTLRKKWAYMADSVFSFSKLPLTIVTTAGWAGLVFSTVYGMVLTVAWSLGQILVQGFTAMAIIQLFLGSTILLALGFVGDISWRTYENSKARPQTVTKATWAKGDSREN